MGDDLGTTDGEVQRAAIGQAAAEVLAFWFDATPAEQRFAKDAALDARIAERFGDLKERLLADGADGWRGSAETLLAAVIVLDQFSRNLHRGEARAFAADPLALELALSGIAAGYHRELAPERRAFLYMPLMHAEDRGVQRFALRCFAEKGLETNLEFARDHADVIARFGRFPTRNEALGRQSGRDELDYLSQPGAGW